jgi:NitT/TauT family transport system substrate-binding protein
MQRSSFLAASAALALCPAVVTAQNLVVVRVASAPNDDLLATLWGLESGAFRKAGLDVQLQKANSGTAVAAAVIGGAVDIGKSSLIAVLAGRAKSIPFVLVAPAGIYTTGTPTAGMIVAVDSPMRTGKDFDGKILGVGALNDLTALSAEAWIDQTGGDAKTLRFIELPASAVAAAVAAGRIDAATLPNPQYTRAVETGQVRSISHPMDAIGSRFIQAGYFAMLDYVTKNRETVAAFRKTIDEAGAYANDHREQMIPILAKFTGIEPKVLQAQPPQLLGTSLDIRLIQPMVAVAVKYHAVPPGFSAREMIDPGAL